MSSKKTADKLKTKGKAKADVADKVKEIKQRQKNWLRERSTERETASHGNKTSGNEMHYTVSAESFEGRTSQHVNNQDSTSHDVQTKEAHIQQNTNKARFKTWMNTRNKDHDGKACPNSGYPGNGLPPQSSLSTVSVNSYDSASDSVTLPPTSRSDQSDICSISSRASTHTLDPDQFDALADQIAERVKAEIRIGNLGSDSRKKDSDGISANSFTKAKSSNHHSLREARGDSSIQSHCCHLCKSVMVPPEHGPMLLIPCGHTLCLMCSRSEQVCPTCDCHLSSATCNIMLQQIIVDYGKNQKRGKHRQAAPYRPNNYTDTKKIDYKEDFQNLCTRCEVLESEAESLNSQMQQLEHQKDGEKQQLANINNEETKLLSKIKELQANLKGIQKHKQDYEYAVLKTETEHGEKSRQLTLLQETLLELEQQKDKVTMLSDMNQY